jgi:predicted alpha-1,2-mannosidase
MRRTRGPRWLSATVAAVTACTAAIAVSGCTAAGTPKATQTPGPAARARLAPAGGLAGYVNPFIGTNPAPNSKYGFGFDTGDVYPGAVAPHGMLAWSPDTTSGIPGGYWYPDDTIKGFSLNHFSGRGCPYEGDIPFMPVPGAVTSSPVTNPRAFQSTFSHSDESASPGYYRVRLNSGVKVALAATTRSGIGQFTYPAGASRASLIINVGGSARGDQNATVSIDPASSTVTGSATANVGCENETYTVYFTVHFDHSFTKYGTWNGGRLRDRSTSAAGPRSGAFLSFDTTNGKPVTARTALSYVSVANAELNLSTEDPGWSLSSVVGRARMAWNRALSVIRASGGGIAEEAMFYTELYHFLIEPAVFNDVNGQYVGFDDKIHRVPPNHTQYANITTWDGYRSFIGLLAFLEPREANDVITSMLNDAAQGGPGLPRWEQANRNSGGMVGDDPDPYIATAYAFGAHGFDTGAALRAMDLGGSVPTATSGGQLVRPNDQQWMADHYDPGTASVSLEYGIDDFSIAAFAKALGRSAIYNKYMPRAQNWEYTFNPATDLAEPKDPAGAFPANYSPTGGTGMIEGDSYQYTPMVPFNVAGLAAAFGGSAEYTKYLEHLYANPDVANSGPNGTGAYVGNEPSEGIAWELDYTGAPEQAQRAIRSVITNDYTPTPGGLPGNDDGGALSSWYLWAAIGMYPETPGVGILALGSPLFPSTEITLGNGKVLTLKATGNTESTPYIHGMTVNGVSWNRAFLPLSAISRGGTIGYALSSTPDNGWASGPHAAPPSFSADEIPAIGYTTPTSQATILPGGNASVTVAARNITGSALVVNWTASPAAGISLSSRSGSFEVPASGRGQQQVRVTAGSAAGTYRVTFHLTTTDGTALPKVVLNVVVTR